MDSIAFGDIHGRGIWKYFITREPQAGKYIFIGDYFDSREDIPPTDQLKNFKDIVDFKRANPEKVILLFGNHDYQYLPGIDCRCSGFQPEQKIDFSEALRDAIKDRLIQMAHLQDQIFFTHAGISKTFIRQSGILPTENRINELFYDRPEAFQFYGSDPYGDDVTQSPIWIRPDSLIRDGIGCMQAVGHTTQEQITCINNTYYFIDTLGTSEQYLKITDGNVVTECKHIKTKISNS